MVSLSSAFSTPQAVSNAFERAYWRELRHAYQEKNDVLFNRDGWLYTVPHDFYRDMFPEGFLQAKGEPNGDGRPNGIALEVTDRTYVGPDGRERRSVRRATVTDDLGAIETFRNSPCAFMAPVSYFGKARSGDNARFLHAIAIDLDGVGVQQLRELLHQMDVGHLPMANYVVNSGTGVHVYYLLEYPFPMYKSVARGLRELKYALTRRVWNPNTTTIPPERAQMQGVLQGYRIAGSGTKLNGLHADSKVSQPYECIAFGFQGAPRWSVEALMGFVPDVGKDPERNELLRVQRAFRSGETTPLEVAREKWPEWYERRVVRGEPRGRWTVKRDLYKWWKRRIGEDDMATVGHRYHCIMALAVFGQKCGVPYEEVEADALSYVGAMEAKTESPDNHFTEEDAMDALAAYGESYVTFPRASLEYLTAVPMPANKRNGRKQAVHMAAMRAVQSVVDPSGKWRNKNGAPDKRNQIRSYAIKHPESNHSEIAAALGVSRPTVIKWLKPGWREEWDAEHTPKPASMPTLVFHGRVVRGGVRVEAAANASVEVVNRSKSFVLVRGARCEPGEACLALTAGPDGVAEGLPDDLPYGTYEARCGGVSAYFQVRDEGAMVEVVIGDDGQ